MGQRIQCSTTDEEEQKEKPDWALDAAASSNKLSAF